MLLYDASHTSHTHARTGIQRVVRSLHAALAAQQPVQPLCYDPHQSAWRALAPWEHANLTGTAAPASAHRSAKWPLRVRLAGYARVLLRAKSPCPAGTALLVPELFSAKIARALPALFARVTGPRVALFHDAIALKYPELTPAKTVARYPVYLRELLAFDGIAAVSEDSRQSLVDYWRWAGHTDHPPVVTLPNAIDLPAPRSDNHTSPALIPVILCVGSLEGRKNHLALLDACEQLWQDGHRFRLRLIGLAHPQTGRAALEKIKTLQAANRPLRYDGPVDDETLATAYAECDFTVYPSLMEGFGLPVQESLSHRRPCICSAHGALGESARDGGCFTLDHLDAASLRDAIAHWLTRPAALADAREQTALRHFRTWPQQARELAAWMQTLPRRTPPGVR